MEIKHAHAAPYTFKNPRAPRDRYNHTPPERESIMPTCNEYSNLLVCFQLISVTAISLVSYTFDVSIPESSGNPSWTSTLVENPSISDHHRGRRVQFPNGALVTLELRHSETGPTARFPLFWLPTLPAAYSWCFGIFLKFARNSSERSPPKGVGEKFLNFGLSWPGFL